MSQFSTILLTYVFPTIGCVLAFLAFGSSLVAVLRVRRAKRLGELNPMPYIGILGQTSGQVIYGSIIKNWFVFMANAPGLIIGLWLTLSTIVHATPRVQNIMTACVMALALYYSAIATITTHLDVTSETRDTIWGFAGAFALLCYYVAPLTTIIKIIKARDSSTLNPLFCIMMFCNMALWLTYGVAIKNPFIWVPEMIGGTLSTTTLILLLVFPRHESSQLREEDAQLEALRAQNETHHELTLDPTPDLEASTTRTDSTSTVSPASLGITADTSRHRNVATQSPTAHQPAHLTEMFQRTSLQSSSSVPGNA